MEIEKAKKDLDGGAGKAQQRKSMKRGMEKLLFCPGPASNLGLKFVPDIYGNAAVVSSMSMLVETMGFDGSSDFVEVGDVLFAMNGELIHFMPFGEVSVELLQENEYCVLSFMEANRYYHLAKEGRIMSKVINSAPRSYFPSFSLGWPFVSASKGNDPDTSNASGLLQNLSEWKRKTAASLRCVLMETKVKQGAWVGDSFLAVGQHKRAMEEYTKVLLRDEREHTVYHKRALAYIGLGLFKEALHDCKQCTVLRPTWPMGYFTKAIILDELGKPLKAISTLVCGICVDPGNRALQIELKRVVVETNNDLVILKGKELVNPVSSVLGEAGVPFGVDRVLITASGSLEQYIEFAPASENDAKLNVCLSQVPENCGLENGDLIHSINGYFVRDLEFRKLCNRFGLDGASGLLPQVVGIISPAKLKRINFEGIEYRMESRNFDLKNDESEEGDMSGERESSLSDSTLTESTGNEAAMSTSTTDQIISDENATFAGEVLCPVIVSGAGIADANGLFYPQEHQNKAFVYENDYGYVISLEHPSPNAWGWVLGKNGRILYYKILPSPPESPMKPRFGFDTSDWMTYDPPGKNGIKAKDPSPMVQQASTADMPSLSLLMTSDNSEFTSLVAIKGFANRAIENGNPDQGVKCYEYIINKLDGDASKVESASDSHLSIVEHARVVTQRSNSRQAKMLADVRSHRLLLLAYVNTADVMLHQGDYEKSLERADKALQLDKRCVLAIYIKAKVLFLLRRLDEARKVCQNGVTYAMMDHPNEKITQDLVHLGEAINAERTNNSARPDRANKTPMEFEKLPSNNTTDGGEGEPGRLGARADSHLDHYIRAKDSHLNNNSLEENSEKKDEEETNVKSTMDRTVPNPPSGAQANENVYISPENGTSSMEETLRQLTKGKVFQKQVRSGKYHKRKFWISGDLSTLCWNSSKNRYAWILGGCGARNERYASGNSDLVVVPGQIARSEIKGVMYGVASGSSSGTSVRVTENPRAFSLITDSRCLVLMAKDEEEAQVWAKHFAKWIG